MHEWSPEVTLDARTASALIREQVPELEGQPVRHLASGWDNTVFTVGDPPAWVFRFPRRAVAVPGVEREMAVLPVLAPLLPLPVSTPAWLGRPSAALGYPWPFFGASYIEGREVAEVEADDRRLTDLARPLARFLRALHGPEPLVAVGHRLVPDPNRRSDMSLRVPWTRERLSGLAASGLWEAPASVSELLDAAAMSPASRESCVVHGDLHLRHLLLDAGTGIAGVIDWGDVGLADPSVDLVLFWSLLPPTARTSFLAEYGSVSEPMLVRSRLLSVFLCSTLALYARHERRADLLRASLAALDRTMAE